MLWPLLIFISAIRADNSKWAFRFYTDPDVRSIPAAGFFPFGGNGKIDLGSVNTYALGTGIDLLNIYRQEKKVALLNISAFLIGLNWTAFESDSIRFIDLMYLRLGPSYRYPSYFKRAALGVQAGMGVVFKSNYDETRTIINYGFDVSFTLNYGEYKPPDFNLGYNNGPVLFFTGLAAGLLGGGLTYWAASDDNAGIMKQTVGYGLGTILLIDGLVFSYNGIRKWYSGKD